MKPDKTLSDICICITLFPSQDRDMKPIKLRFVKLFLPLVKEVFIIGDDLPELESERIHIIKQREWESGKSLPIKVAIFMFLQLSTCFSLIKIAKHCDIVVPTSLGDLEVMPLVLAKLLRKKVVMGQAGSYPKSLNNIYGKKLFGMGKIIPSIAALLARINHALSDGIVVDTETTIEFLKLNKYRSKIFVCGFAYIDTEIFKIKRDLEDRQNIVGYIGRFSEEKGVLNFIRAIPLILAQHQNVEFLMCGDGPLLNEIKQGLKQSNSDSKVTFTGRVSAEAVPDYLNEMKLLVVPSYIEGLPKVVLEAVTCGTPVLATSVGGIPELIKDEETGFILEDNSPECIARNIVRALSQPRLYEITQNARNFIESKYTYEPMVASWRDALQKLMTRRKKL